MTSKAVTGAPLIAAKRVNGTPVYNAAGERLGTIEDIMLEKRSGEAIYAIMSFGGLLGIGEKYHPLPWDVLTYDTSKNGYVVGLDKDQLKRAPYYSRDELTENDAPWREKVFGYYEARPYWE